MSVKNVDVWIPEDLMPYVYTIRDGKTVNDKVALTMVIGLFVSKIVTLEKAAELADKSIWDFQDILESYEIPWGEYTEESCQLDNDTINKLLEANI